MFNNKLLMKKILLIYCVFLAGCFSQEKPDFDQSGYFYRVSENGHSYFDKLLIVRDSILLIMDYSNGSPWVYIDYQLTKNGYQTTDGSFKLHFSDNSLCVFASDNREECFVKLENTQNIISDTAKFELLLIKEFLEKENGVLDSAEYEQVTDWLFMTVFGKKIKINNRTTENGPLEIGNCVGCH
ncbi:hypothetical protein QWY85_00315 [Neolewinella lacunae]|uniref:Lipoprotein n=1 Tax=Neolewinella lacunae TaxID=1517758 RepID=A0A923T9S3_9BACT|nr:hypothetical protein [Neolewinella lacunae]MBC6995368.1 hypothetical protein [Neolewinella lacunae]MDN3633080.1 hypothetical protein [Neolewinella lacunae]